MKKLLVGICALVSFSAFAKEINCKVTVLKNNELISAEGAKSIKTGETYHYTGEKFSYEVRRNKKNTILILHDLTKEISSYSSFQSNANGSTSIVDNRTKEKVILGCN